jgi:hypothetical protein
VDLREGIDYYVGEDGLLVMTEGYLRRRGSCCESGCRHCPYGFHPSRRGAAGARAEGAGGDGGRTRRENT